MGGEQDERRLGSWREDAFDSRAYHSERIRNCSPECLNHRVDAYHGLGYRDARGCDPWHGFRGLQSKLVEIAVFRSNLTVRRRQGPEGRDANTNQRASPGCSEAPGGCFEKLS